jgi:hypothetical protein
MEMIRVSVSIPKDVDRTANIEAAMLDIPKQEVFELALRQFLKMPARKAAK